MLLKSFTLVFLNHLVIFDVPRNDLLTRHVLSNFIALCWYTVASLATIFIGLIWWLQEALVRLARSACLLFYCINFLLSTLVRLGILLTMLLLFHFLLILQVFELLLDALLFIDLLLQFCDLFALFSLSLELALMLHGARLLDLLLDFLYTFRLSSTARRTFARD